MSKRSKISNSFDNKKINKKRRTLSNWINDYEIHAYNTEDMNNEIKELLINVYDNDKDVRDRFITKYVNSFSETMYERIKPKDYESLYKHEATFDAPEKSEFKIFIEKRNKFLKENEKIKNSKYYSNYRSENKKIKNNLYDFDLDFNDVVCENNYFYKKINKKRNKSNKDYLDDKKRNNSKVRDYAKSRYKMISKYNDIFSNNNDNSNSNNNIRDNKKNIINDYCYQNKEKTINNNNNKNKNNLKYEKNSFLSYKNIRITNNKNNNKNKNNVIENKIIKKDYDSNKIAKLLLLNNKVKQKEKKEIKVYSRKNKYIDKDETMDIVRYNQKNKEVDLQIIKQILLDNNLNKGEEYKKKVGDNNEEDSYKYNDEYLEDNGDEIKKINVSGIKYKINGETKKEDINEEIILDKNNISNSINKANEEFEPNKESNLFHKKLIKKNYLNDNSLYQKTEKDIKENNIRLSNISKESLKKYLYNNENKMNKSYKIRYLNENEIYGMNIFSYLDKEKRKVNTNENSYININNYKSYNDIRKERKKNLKKFYENNKDKDNDNDNDKDLKNININNKNDINEKKEIKNNEKESTENSNNDNKNNNNRNYNSETIEKNKINIENKIEEIKTNDNNLINNSTNEIINGNRRKRFHRLINSNTNT